MIHIYIYNHSDYIPIIKSNYRLINSDYIPVIKSNNDFVR